jgi:hypothetical protein
VEKGPPLTDAFDELEDYAGDISWSSFLNRKDTIIRFSHLLHPEQPIGALLQTLTSQVDFDAWYQETSSPKYGMAPAARLEWPADIKQRVALQAELIRRIADHKVDLDLPGETEKFWALASCPAWA